MFFFSSVELLLSGGALSALLACWGDKKPAVLGLMSPACWFIPPRDPSPACLYPSLFLSFSSSLVRSAAQGGVDKVVIFLSFFLKHRHFLFLSNTHTHLHWTLSPAGSLGLWKKRALWLRAACWACSKHTHSASGERSWERRGLREHRGLKTAASDPARC